MIDDEERYRFGKTKLFFRAGQVAYMEKLRGERLRDCGIIIQKHVKGFLYREKQKKRTKMLADVQGVSSGCEPRLGGVKSVEFLWLVGQYTG